MLCSMYPGEEEIVFVNPLARDNIQRYLDGDRQDADCLSSLPSLSFSLKLLCSLANGECSLTVECRLPLDYPLECAAEVHVTSDMFTRQSQRDLNDELKAYACSMEGDCILLSVVQWVQDNVETYVQEAMAAKNISDASAATAATAKVSDKFGRVWLYMHHIYSKHKRKDILDFTHELKLTGFCLPGKPGVVCVEGDLANVNDFFQRLRNMTWKRMTCKYREEMTGPVDELRAFSGFGEMNFDAHGGRHNHMDMGLFFQYLEKHKLGEMFEVLFGVEGRLAENDE